MKPYTFAQYARETWPALVLSLAISTPLAVGMSVLSAGCTPGERATAGAAVSTLGPALCNALVGLGADGRAGLVCADAAKVLGAALTLARADTRPTMVEVAGPVGATCEPIMLADVVPGRDPREYVCRGALDEAAIRRAFSVGHAR